MELKFEHRPAAHCENGVISNMLRFYGFELSEPMIFGLASGMFFSHTPFVKMAGMAVTSFRTFPGILFSRISKLLGFKITTKRYLNEKKAIADMEKVLLSGKPVGCVVGMYYLPYVPLEYRFHFNGHNICIIGKDEQTGEYIVSDPNAVEKVRITKKDLIKVRFAKGGTYPLLGQMYWIESVPNELPDLVPMIKKAIKKNCWLMTSQPKWLPYFGVNGIYYLSRRIKNWEKEMGPRKASLNLAQIIRMLEEIGTGGAGFRYMFGAFLQEAAQKTGIEELNDYSKRITDIGDLWRDFAYKAARIFKKRQGETYTYDDLSEVLYKIAVLEEKFYKELKTVV
ncbi:MAG TPA: BtrH N-terminal domain-containing protein [Paludibacteraceae bacterium]|nr:BtrH N-terminal domain-containing protein [Paludibacteraceae bacterium]HPH62091.1 BtrH N-terminal domain-containing protein [Paludibacteraceae bacterium]HQF49367.1 BtrH N-terminal domain-containing protein [Paludibacteraceae bacterium]